MLYHHSLKKCGQWINCHQDNEWFLFEIGSFDDNVSSPSFNSKPCNILNGSPLHATIQEETRLSTLLNYTGSLQD